MKLKNLRYELHGKNPKGHPEKVMKDLGIKYTNAMPFPVADCWVFYGCSNVPDPLPKYLVAIPIYTQNEKGGWITHPDGSTQSMPNPFEHHEADFDRENNDDEPFPDDPPNDEEFWAGDGGEADGGGASGDWSDDE